MVLKSLNTIECTKYHTRYNYKSNIFIRTVLVHLKWFHFKFHIKSNDAIKNQNENDF